jgi:hypothetical protein
VRRRAFLASLAGAAAAGCDLALREGLLNGCRATLPDALASHALVTRAFNDLDPGKCWDVHCHLFGDGDSGSGIWVNPAMASVLRPMQFVQRLFYLNAGCVHDSPGRVDASVVDRLRNQCDALPPGMKLVLMAFDWARDESGTPLPDRSTFRVPDEYAAAVAATQPARFEWAASVHPYAKDAEARLEWAAAHGARAIKWLPTALGIDPASPKCVRCPGTTNRSAIRSASGARSTPASGSSSRIARRWASDRTSTAGARRRRPRTSSSSPG